MLPRSRSGETATRAVGNGGNSFYVSYDAINSSSFCVDCDAVGGGSFCDNCDAVVPALFCANRVGVIWASSTFALGLRTLDEAAGWTRIGVSNTRSGLYIATYLLHAVLYTIYLLAALY